MKCVECEDSKATHEDYRDPPLSIGICLCADCCEGSLIEAIEQAEYILNNLKEVLAEINPNSIYIKGVA